MRDRGVDIIAWAGLWFSLVALIAERAFFHDDETFVICLLAIACIAVHLGAGHKYPDPLDKPR